MVIIYIINFFLVSVLGQSGPRFPLGLHHRVRDGWISLATPPHLPIFSLLSSWLQVMGSMMASLGEGLSLASASGLDASALITILDQGAMSNPMFRLKGPKIIADDHAPNFPLKHQSKVQPSLHPMTPCQCHMLEPDPASVTPPMIILPSSCLTHSACLVSLFPRKIRTWTLPCVWASRWVRR